MELRSRVGTSAYILTQSLGRNKSQKLLPRACGPNCDRQGVAATEIADGTRILRHWCIIPCPLLLSPSPPV